MSPRATRSLPTFQPTLLTPRREPFDDPAWLFEPKYDGYRGLLYVTLQGCHFRSKREHSEAPSRCTWTTTYCESELDSSAIANGLGIVGSRHCRETRH